MEDNALKMGILFREKLEKTNSKHIKEVRGKGLLNAITINHPGKEAGWQLCLRMMENGLLAKPTHGDKIRFAPPLIINEEQVLEAVEIIEKSLGMLK